MRLKTSEDTDRLNYRFPVSIKQELDELAERCKKEKLDFIAALSEGLRGVAKAIRQQLDNKIRCIRQRHPRCSTPRLRGKHPFDSTCTRATSDMERFSDPSAPANRR